MTTDATDTLPVDPARPITDDDVQTFWRDGVVVLRGVLDSRWLEALAGPIERAIGRREAVDLGGLADTSASDSPAFAAGVDHWRHDEVFRAFSMASPLGSIAAALLRSESVWLWEDSVLVKEAGSPFETRFHTDASYFHLAGEQVCTMWTPLDLATPEGGVVRWVRGSHRSSVEYRPNLFVSDEPIPDTLGEVVPDVFASPELAEAVLCVTLEPGDVSVHHARTLHGAGPNTTDGRRRAVSVRYCGDDSRYLHKPGVPTRPGLDAVEDGDPVGEPWCPRVWPRLTSRPR